MARQRTSPMEEMILVATKLPWWACLLLALVSYAVLHVMAMRPVMPATVVPGQMGDAVARGLITTLAMFGQYVMPFAFALAALLSAVNEYRNKKSGTFVPNHLDVAPPSRKRVSTEASVPMPTPGNSGKINRDFDHMLPGGEEELAIENPQPVPLPQQWGMSVIQMMEWKRFEIVTREFLKMTGYDAHETKVGADGGVDIRVTKPSNDTFQGIVQCKAWNSYRVGVKPVRELYGVMAAEKATAGMVITSGTFTAEAEEFAKGKVKLISGVNFLELIRKLPPEKQQRLLDIALEGDYQTPTCPQCDLKMTLRENKSGKNPGSKFWGCVRYPHCRQTLVYTGNGSRVRLPS